MRHNDLHNKRVRTVTCDNNCISLRWLSMSTDVLGHYMFGVIVNQSLNWVRCLFKLGLTFADKYCTLTSSWISRQLPDVNNDGEMLFTCASSNGAQNVSCRAVCVIDFSPVNLRCSQRYCSENAVHTDFMMVSNFHEESVTCDYRCTTEWRRRSFITFQFKAVQYFSKCCLRGHIEISVYRFAIHWANSRAAYLLLTVNLLQLSRCAKQNTEQLIDSDAVRSARCRSLNVLACLLPFVCSRTSWRTVAGEWDQSFNAVPSNKQLVTYDD